MSITPQTGVIKGILTGLNYDSLGKFLYDSDGVVQADVSFNELLFDCTADGTAGQICADPVTGTYGYHDYETDFYVADALRIESLHAWFEPMSGKWLDESYTHLVLQQVDSHQSGHDASLLKPWKIFRGQAADFITALQTAHIARKRVALGEPTPDIETIKLTVEDHQPPPLPIELPAASSASKAIPSEIPASGLASRLESYCKAAPFKPFDGRSGYEELPALKVALAELLSRRVSVTDRISKKLQRVAELEGRAFEPRVYPRSRIENKLLAMLDGMDFWHVLYQGELDDLKGIALLAFRESPGGLVLDWWPVEMNQLHGGGAAGGFGLSNLTTAGSLDPSSLLRLVYSDECKGE